MDTVYRVRVGLILSLLLVFRLRVFKVHGPATSNPWLLGVGLAVFVLGLALAVWARVYLGRNWGMLMSQRADPTWSQPVLTRGSGTPSTAVSSSARSARR